MDKTEDFAMGLVGQPVGTASSGYREICKGQSSTGATIVQRKKTMSVGKSGHGGTTRASFRVVVLSHQSEDIIADSLWQPSCRLSLWWETLSLTTTGPKNVSLDVAVKRSLVGVKPLVATAVSDEHEIRYKPLDENTTCLCQQ